MRETGLLISDAGDLQGWWVLLNYRNLISIIAILRSINLGFSVITKSKNLSYFVCDPIGLWIALEDQGQQ